jgi:lysophospholipase L1-like esterase
MSRTSSSLPLPRFLALGDSYTIGEGVAAADSWPAQLARRLRARGTAIDDPWIIAKTGWTTDELALALDATRFSPPYALVTLLIGVNNQYRGGDRTQYADEFSILLARAIALAGARADRVIAVSIPDWGVTQFAREKTCDQARVALEIDAFNATARTIAAANGVVFVDVTAITRAAADAAGQLVGDGLHPSPAQYASWSEALLPAAARALGIRVTPDG